MAADSGGGGGGGYSGKTEVTLGPVISGSDIAFGNVSFFLDPPLTTSRMNRGLALNLGALPLLAIGAGLVYWAVSK